MGRPTWHKAPKDEPIRLFLKRKRWVDGDYDENGTYFGNPGGTSLYWYVDESDTVDGIVKASSRREAKAKVREHYPKAVFLRWTPRGPTHCECDNTHEQNGTVCRWCWKHGRRTPSDPEVVA